MSMMDAQGQPTRFYKDILPKEIPDDRAYVDILNKIAPYTMTVIDGLDATYALFQTIKYITQNNIPGDMVGVRRLARRIDDADCVCATAFW